MKKIAIILSVILMYSYTLSIQAETVVIDAGHGGIDSGAVCVDESYEKDINLEISEKLETMFALLGVNTVMTRTNDSLIGESEENTIRQNKVNDLHIRADIANSSRDNILLSIHQNKYSSPKCNGTQVFYSGNNALSEILAQFIQDEIKTALQPENERQICKSGSEIYLLNTAEIPAVMVECGFVSNYDELQKLKTDEYQKQICFCIIKGYARYIKETDIQ